MPDGPRPPGLTYLAGFRIDVGTALAVTPPEQATRRIVPITGGSVRGPEFTATILPYGADFQTQRSPATTDLDARYALQTPTGELVFVTNTAVRSGAPEDIEALASGRRVPAESIYFRCCPQFTTDAPRWGFLNDRLFVGSGRRDPEQVVIDVWMVD
ncbi:DUF3237 domain-containing protein [Gordonia jinhuaensis]|uniref:UPF0311 protein GCM10011489_34900 n=1 Tax=Gordonia jinhuaensis TaxID=1517702 RepID=A0A916TGV0_9ACTN|nr:DUF3237 domain-containing protein [Gordonia jinhuaensis]GGB44475.1 UPF0311 protein [Gordonia jinhuaensis]